jgi:hypothetical protein
MTHFLWNVTRSDLSIWPDYAFDTLYARNRIFGFETIFVNDPDGVAKPANLSRKLSVRAGRMVKSERSCQPLWFRKQAETQPPYEFSMLSNSFAENTTG